MIRIYRMWLFVKIVEQYCIGRRVHPEHKNVTDIDCGKEFIKRRAMFRRRKYSPDDSMIAYSMAIDKGYILNDGKLIGKAEQEVAITGDGLLFTTPTGLIVLEAKTIAPIGSILAVIIAACALGMSLYTAHRQSVMSTSYTQRTSQTTTVK